MATSLSQAFSHPWVCDIWSIFIKDEDAVEFTPTETLKKMEYAPSCFLIVGCEVDILTKFIFARHLENFLVLKGPMFEGFHDKGISYAEYEAKKFETEKYNVHVFVKEYWRLEDDLELYDSMKDDIQNAVDCLKDDKHKTIGSWIGFMDYTIKFISQFLHRERLQTMTANRRGVTTTLILYEVVAPTLIFGTGTLKRLEK